MYFKNIFIITPCIFFLLMLFPLKGYAIANNNEIEKPIDHCLSYSEYDDKLECLKEIVIFDKPQKEKAFAVIMNDWENRDGAMGHIISDTFLEILSADYKFFFSQMKQYRHEFDNWLYNLGVLSFTWFKDPPSPLEEKRKKLIAFLESISDLEGDTDSLRIRLINALIEVKSRQID